MIDTNNIEQAKLSIKIEKTRPIIIKAQDDNFNRKILEYGKFDILLSPEKGKRQRTLRNIDSGLNHVLAEIASKNKVTIGIDMKELNNLKREDKAKNMERIIQNIKICRKSKAKITLLNYKNKINALSFLLSLGASTKQTKEAL